MYRCSSIEQLNIILMTERNKVVKWFSANRLILNANKTHSMLFTNKLGNLTLCVKLQNILLEDKVEICFLGVND